MQLLSVFDHDEQAALCEVTLARLVARKNDHGESERRTRFLRCPDVMIYRDNLMRAIAACEMDIVPTFVSSISGTKTRTCNKAVVHIQFQIQSWWLFFFSQCH
jgi:hypothetical protein